MSGGACGDEEESGSLSRFRLTVGMQAVRDLAVPLGAFANVYCSWVAPPLAGSQAGRRHRTAPPVLLPRHGAVALPMSSSVSYEFEVEDSRLFEWLAQQPLHVEVWHNDKYMNDVLLGVAVIDLGELLGVASAKAPSSGVAARWIHEENVVALRPEAEASGDETAAHRDPARVAVVQAQLVLDHLIHTTEEWSRHTTAIGKPSRRSPPRVPVPQSRPLKPTHVASPAARPRLAREPAAVPTTGRAPPQVRGKKEAAVEREERSAREEELLAALSREWRVEEAKRTMEVRSQKLALSKAQAAVKAKLAQIHEHEQALCMTYEKVEERCAALEERHQHELASLQVSSYQQAAALQQKLEVVQASLDEARSWGEALKEQLATTQDRIIRSEEQMTLLRSTQDEGNQRAVQLHAEVGRLTAALKEEGRMRDLAEKARDQAAQELMTARMRVAALEAEQDADGRWREELTQRRLRSAEHESVRAEAEELHRLKEELGQLHEQRRAQQLQEAQRAHHSAQLQQAHRHVAQMERRQPASPTPSAATVRAISPPREGSAAAARAPPRSADARVGQTQPQRRREPETVLSPAEDGSSEQSSLVLAAGNEELRGVADAGAADYLFDIVTAFNDGSLHPAVYYDAFEPSSLFAGRGESAEDVHAAPETPTGTGRTPSPRGLSLDQRLSEAIATTPQAETQGRRHFRSRTNAPAEPPATPPPTPPTLVAPAPPPAVADAAPPSPVPLLMPADSTEPALALRPPSPSQPGAVPYPVKDEDLMQAARK
ncbi:hypothetical protein AB1Y20_013106 [Prymnesium parvum]|uniref:Uncharacterized protein n=1 Tax=Prymnesium parvum TaxID=97485 RepID=A0AB34IJP1_PRYPA